MKISMLHFWFPTNRAPILYTHTHTHTHCVCVTQYSILHRLLSFQGVHRALQKLFRTRKKNVLLLNSLKFPYTSFQVVLHSILQRKLYHFSYCNTAHNIYYLRKVG